uniref:Uncharacterized protein n=1 Tax=Triticum urartu TaxID=4572 RepID=A0A8R7JUH2_TRIUA
MVCHVMWSEFSFFFLCLNSVQIHGTHTVCKFGLPFPLKICTALFF